MLYRQTTPIRCGAQRKATFWEMFKYRTMGKMAGFDPEHECRCSMYEGHEQHAKGNPRQARHEDIHANTWAV
jgi:hypothetical protein